ncbi:MAG: STAS-like domain-containing protein [Nostoc sp. JL34]|nr:STAS-like domain-containing protein [Nostoc sp. JL34]
MAPWQGNSIPYREDPKQNKDELVHPELLALNEVELDFAGVEIFASPFFNFAIGQLLRDIKPETLNRLLKFSNLNTVGKQILKLVIENSKRYYSDPDFRSRVDQVISEQANTQ